MSVIFWDRYNLGEVAGWIADRSHDRDDMVTTIARDLSNYSMANVAAFNATYADRHGPRKTPPLTAEIIAAVPAPGRSRTAEVLSIVELLEYNACSNDGEDFLLEYPAAARGLASVLSSVVSRLAVSQRGEYPAVRGGK